MARVGVVEPEIVWARFFTGDGRLMQLPRKRAFRLLVLDRVVQRFEPGAAYPEREVDVVLKQVFDDHAALRRELVDFGFLTRESNVYRRSDGDVEREL